MRAGRAAFQALLLAMRTWHEITFRTRRQMHDQADRPDEPAEERHRLRVFRISVLRVGHYPDAGKNPAAKKHDPKQELDETASAVDTKNTRGGRSRCRIASLSARARRSFLRENSGSEKEPWRRGDQSLHRAEMLRTQREPLSTQ